MPMSQMRRVIQRRNNLSEQEGEQIEGVLRAYSERRISKEEAAHQLGAYVPNQAGLDLDDLLPVLLALLSGRQGSSDISDLIGSFLGGRQDQGYAQPRSNDLGDMIGALLGGGQSNAAAPNDNSARGMDLNDLIGAFLNRDQQAETRSPQQPGGGLFDLLEDLLGGDQDATPYRATTDRPTTGDHNLRRRR